MKLKYPLLTALLLGVVSSAPAAVRTWDGGGSNNGWTTAANWAGNVAPRPGDELVFPTGAARQMNNNDFPAGTAFNSITISGGEYLLTGNPVTLNAGINAANTAAPTYISIPITLNSDQTITTGNAGVNFYLYGAINTGNNTLTIAGNGSAQVVAAITGTGGFVKTGSGWAFTYGDNTFSGPVQIIQGGLFAYGGNALGAATGSTTVSDAATLTLINAFTVAEPLVLSGTLNNVSGTKTLTGNVTLAGSSATIQVVSGAGLTINGAISGPGGLTKASTGNLTLGANNSYLGTTTINAGTLTINGTQPQSPVILNGGTLNGAGTVGTITSSGGLPKLIGPGGSVGILTCNSVALSDSTTFAVALNGSTPGSGYDQLRVNGTVNLGDSTLTATLGAALSGGETLVIIDNDGSDPINGTFNGLPEGAAFNVGNHQFSISYVGGSGNDVVLTAPVGPMLEMVPAGAGFATISWTPGTPGYVLQETPTLPPSTWTNSPSGNTNPITVPLTSATRFYRLFKP